MNKQDITIVVILFLGLLGWGYFQRQQAASRPPVPAPTESAAAGVTNTVDQVAAPAVAVPAAEITAVAPAPDAPASATAVEPVPEPVKHALPEQTLLLTNAVANVTVSSWGGSIARVELKDYPETVDEGSGPVVLDLSGHPALSLTGLSGFSTAHDYELEYASNLVSGYWFAVAGRTNILGQDQIVTYTNAQTRTTSYRARAELRD